MGYPEILLLSLALAADAVAVASVVGLRSAQQRALFRISFHFGLFQALFAAAGALLGQLLMHWIADLDHWLVGAVLAGLGLRMIVEALTDRNEPPLDLSRGWAMVGLSVAVSIDALGAGLALPSAEVPLPTALLMIGLASLLLPALAMRYAHALRRRSGPWLELGGGVILIGLAVRFVLQHLLA